jgi:predicted regulator of Ras-like GTPase activity (Roadblock/LC7/MglB family)
MTHAVAQAAGVAELLDELTAELPDAYGAVVLSTDGLIVAASGRLGRDYADYLAAASAGLNALVQAVGRHSGAAVRQAVVEMEYALLVVAPVGPVAVLAVIFDGAPDFTTLGGRIAEVAERVGDRLLAAPPDALALAAGWGSGS